MAPITKTPVMVLQELTVKEGLPPPDFQIVYSISGTHENRFDYVVAVAGIKATGTGPSKQIGKHEAAHNALKILKEMGIYNPVENPVAEFRASLKDGSPLKSASELQNICIENKIPAPEFIEISSVGPPHAKEFTMECRISSIITEAKANTKKMAKQLAAKEMLERIKDIMPELILEANEANKRLLDKETEAVSKYNVLVDVIPDKSVKVEDIPYTLKKLMNFKNLKYEAFQQNLHSPSEENVKIILNKLEVHYEIELIQENPPVVAIILKIDTPFVTMGMGRTHEEAKMKALKNTFKTMDFFMQLEV